MYAFGVPNRRCTKPSRDGPQNEPSLRNEVASNASKSKIFIDPPPVCRPSGIRPTEGLRRLKPIFVRRDGNQNSASTLKLAGNPSLIDLLYECLNCGGKPMSDVVEKLARRRQLRSGAIVALVSAALLAGCAPVPAPAPPPPPPAPMAAPPPPPPAVPAVRG